MRLWIGLASYPAAFVLAMAAPIDKGGGADLADEANHADPRQKVTF